MPPFIFNPLQEAIDRYQLLKNAEAAVMTGQAYSIAGRSMTRANLADIHKEMARLEAKIIILQRGGIRIRAAVPL